MGDENTPATPQAGGADPINHQPQAGAPDPQAGDGLNEHISLADAKKLRSEALNLRQRLKESESLLTELKTFKEQAEAAQLSDTEKRDRAVQQREKQLADLQTQHDDHVRTTLERTIKYEVKLQAAELGVNPKRLDYVSRMLDWEEIETNEQGEPTNIKELIDKLIKDMPELIGKPAQAAPTAGGATAPARSQSESGEVTQAYVADVMSGKIPWGTLSQDRRTAVLNWQAQHSYRF